MQAGRTRGESEFTGEAEMETTIQPSIEFDNDLSEHRQALIEALRAEGMNAYEYHSGGGLMHVVVDLVNEEGSDDLLQIATGSVSSPCDVMLMGWNEQGNVQSDSCIRTLTLADATSAFTSYTAESEMWLEKFRSGALDV